MAWSSGEIRATYFEGNYFQADETVYLTQVASTSAGYIRLSINYIAAISNPNYSVKATQIGITVNGVRYNSNYLAAYAGSTNQTVYIDLPNSVSGQNATVNFFFSNKGTWIGAIPAYVLNVNAGEGVAAVSVNRTSTTAGVGTIGAVYNAGIIYPGDVLTVTAVPAPGFELYPYPTSVTVTGDTTITVTAKRSATARIFTGGAWLLHLIYIYASGAFRLHMAYVWTGGGWKLCS